MSFDVPYLSDAEIEGEVYMLLKSFEAKYGTIQTTATPLDEILENHLGLAIEVCDLGHPAILGQLDITENVIRINTILDPSTVPDKEGRYNFTGGHEAGHQVLHRHLVEEMMRNTSFLDEAEKEPEKIILCRTEDKKSPIEIQADKFSSSLLMPRNKVIAEFLEYTQGKGFISEPHLLQSLRHNRPFLSQCFHNPRYVPSDDDLLNHAFKDLAKIFRVSMQPMVIRLRILGILGKIEQEEMAFG